MKLITWVITLRQPKRQWKKSLSSRVFQIVWKRKVIFTIFFFVMANINMRWWQIAFYAKLEWPNTFGSLRFYHVFIDEVDHMGDNIAATKTAMEKESAIKGIPTTLEMKGNFLLLSTLWREVVNCILCQTWRNFSNIFFKFLLGYYDQKIFANSLY